MQLEFNESEIGLFTTYKGKRYELKEVNDEHENRANEILGGDTDDSKSN